MTARSPGRRGVLLDRDGTLIDVVRDADLGVVVTAFHPSQLRLLPGVIEGLRLLASHGFTLAIATNQPGAAKGQVPRDAIARTNDALAAMLRAEGIELAAIAVCLHHPDGGPGGDPSLVGPCECRKPKPGLLRSLLRDLDLDPAATFMVGDARTDIEAGRAAGTRTALLFDPGRCEICPLRSPASGAATSDTADSGAATGGAATSDAPDVVAPRFDRIARAIVDALV